MRSNFTITLKSDHSLPNYIAVTSKDLTHFHTRLCVKYPVTKNIQNIATTAKEIITLFSYLFPSVFHHGLLEVSTRGKKDLTRKSSNQ